MTAEELPDPELLARLVEVAVRTKSEGLAPVATAAAQMLETIANKIRAEDEEAGREFVGRCRALAETRGSKRVYMAWTTHTYQDALILVEWTYPTNHNPPFEPYDASVHVLDPKTRDKLGYWVGTNLPIATVGGYRLHSLLAHVRQDMVLDDIARQT